MMEISAKRHAILDAAPVTSQGRFLGCSLFHKFCCVRFRRFINQADFEDWLTQAERSDVLYPAYISEGRPYYSEFQVWQVWNVSDWPHFSGNTQRPAKFSEFDRLLPLFVQIQDYYLPLVRSDQRFGQVSSGGTFFTTATTYTLHALFRGKDQEISCKRFEPVHVLAESGLTPADLRNWICKLAADADFIDPIKEWGLLVRFVDYSKRQQLKYDALLAQDFRELAEILRLFHSDASEEPIFRDILESKYGPIAEGSWLEKVYGDSLRRPWEMLEYVVNLFGLNAKPRAIIFTEGEEWPALYRLYEEVGVHPAYSGIEFRSLGGSGEFSVANWQTFIEYMHEKQIIVYFVVDKEGKAENQANRLSKAPRRFRHHILKEVIPSKDRICLWSSSFEEANFSDEEIVSAFSLQGKNCSVEAVNASRSSGVGLIKAVGKKLGLEIDKRQLVVDLIDMLILWRRAHPNEPRRPVEDFVYESAQLIMLNHQPIDPESRKENYETGLLG